MIHIKPGVRLYGITPQMALAVLIVEGVWANAFPETDVVITAVMDGKHGPKSKHYQGNAVDLRIRNFAGSEFEFDAEDYEMAKKAIELLRETLGLEFDVVLEDDHIHIEFDPDRG